MSQANPVCWSSSLVSPFGPSVYLSRSSLPRLWPRGCNWPTASLNMYLHIEVDRICITYVEALSAPALPCSARGLKKPPVSHCILLPHSSSSSSLLLSCSSAQLAVAIGRYEEENHVLAHSYAISKQPPSISTCHTSSTSHLFDRSSRRTVPLLLAHPRPWHTDLPASSAVSLISYLRTAVSSGLRSSDLLVDPQTLSCGFDNARRYFKPGMPNGINLNGINSLFQWVF